MYVTALTLPSPQPARLAAFYRTVLGLDESPDQSILGVILGRTTVSFVAGPDVPGSHHLAFTLPARRFDAAKSWLGSRLELLTYDGADEFVFEPPFGPARSLYFADVDGSVLEFIARPELVAAGSEFLPSRDVVGLGEVAVPVQDVPEAVAELHARWGLTAVLNGPEFAAVGDHDGMFILVEPDRGWMPTGDRYPNPTALQVTTDVGGPPPITFSNGTIAS